MDPGGLFITDTPARVKTVLGSCIAITIRAPKVGIAAISHCLLPRAGAPVATLSRQEAARYVDATIHLMLAAFSQRGVRPNEMQVKLFGGADTELASGYRVGTRNVEEALEGLAARGIVPACQVVGGNCGRVIEFDTNTGDVFVKQLPPARGGWIRQGS